MSANNQIVILQDSENNFRVKHMQIHEDFSSPEFVYDIFSDSKILKSMNEAMKEAKFIEEEIKKMGGIVEYGIDVKKIDYPFPRPRKKILAKQNDLFAILGFIKFKAPWIPVCLNLEEKQIVILSGKYGTDLNWFCASIKSDLGINFQEEDCGGV